MLDYRAIRSRYEQAIKAVLGPYGMPLHYDNVQETPIPETGSVAEYAVIMISFPSSTEPDLCGGLVAIRGNIQINLYGPRGAGMSRLELVASEVICALMQIDEFPNPPEVRTHVGGIQGPTPVLSGQDPQAAVVISAPFSARIES